MRFWLIITLVLGLWASISTAQEAPATNPDACLAEGAYDADVDYFPEKITTEYTTGFTVEYFNSYKVLTVTRPWNDADEADAVQYLLVQCGAPIPTGYESAQVVSVPVTSAVSLSTTYLPYFDLYGVLDALVGVDMASLATNVAVLDKLVAGELTEIAPNFELDIETALELDPQLIFTYGFGFDTDSYRQLVDAGLDVALVGEFAETNPLARAEWGKFIATFFNAEGVAEAEFEAMTDDYMRLFALTADVESRPTVFLNSPFDGTWYMAGGQGYMAQFLTDAGADYLWSDDEGTATLFLDFESVFDRAQDAQFWLNGNQFWMSTADILAEDPRFGDFDAVNTGGVWINNLAINEAFANDFYESGVAFPNLILADLIAIFHPDLLPDHEFVYYRNLGE
ncbi:MAG: ABC transporter substrate-binding protein [bacterium]|nr:ABC transporter substrate-binding protein [bacterium]